MNSVLSEPQKSLPLLNASLTFNPYGRLSEAAGAAKASSTGKSEISVSNSLRIWPTAHTGPEHGQTLWYEFGIKPL